MTDRGASSGAGNEIPHRFWLLLIALMALLIGYPYFENTRAGAFLGGVTSLLTLTGAVYAVRTNRWSLLGGVALALATAAASIMAFQGGVRGHPIVEATFSIFYAYMTLAVFLEVIKTNRVTADTMYGTVCVYLLLGITFGSFYDLIETLQPGSFQINVESGLTEIRWRTLIFFSFMTLTTVGLGDVTPVTAQAQSLTSIEGVMGVLYVAVLVARIVGVYARRSAEE
jgi:voltage-gated potassium channel Kch